MACNIPIKINNSTDIKDSGIYEVLKHARPEWSKDIKIEVLSGGFINKSWLCTNQDEKVVVRVNPDIKRIPFVDRDYEAKIVEYLDSKNLIPKYYGRFQNGLVYEYAEGVNPNPEQMRDETLMKLVVDKLYLIHTVGVPKKPTYRSDKIDSVIFHYHLEVAAAVDDTKFHPEIRAKFLEAIPSMDYLRKESELCRRNIYRIYRSFPHVFCHQDLWSMNLVYSEQKVEFLDWETADYGPAVGDLACLVESYIEEPFWRKWVELYFARAGWEQDEDVMNEWYDSMLHCLSSLYLGCMFWGLWNLSLVDDLKQQHELMDFVIDRYKDYMQLKEKGHQSKDSERS